jgi:peptide/nickel transport system substrate-binding protein
MDWFSRFSQRKKDVGAGDETNSPPSGDSMIERRRPLVLRLFTSLLVLTVVAAFLAGVATNRLPRWPWGGASPTPVRGGSIVDALVADPISLIPQKGVAAFDQAVDAAIWSPLWYGDPTGILHPALASELPSLDNGGISDDLKTWTIHLKPNLKWSDGSPLTASDVAFSLNTFANPHFAAGKFWYNDPNDPIDFLGATVIDPTTVRYTLAHPYVGMNALLADGYSAPIPQEVFGAMAPGDIPRSHQSFFPTVTSGPFKMSEHTQGAHITVTRNPYYYQGPDKPYLDQITFKPFASPDAVLHAAQLGQLDTAFGAWSSISPDRLESYRALSGYTTYLDSHPTRFEMIQFNLTTPILKDKVVRQALTMSLDPKQIAALAQPGLFKPACDGQLGTFAHEPILTCYQQDPAQARQLLGADGWTLGADGYRHKDGKLLELTYSTTNLVAYPWRAATEMLAQSSWAQIGVKLDVQNYGVEGFFSDLASGRFDIGQVAAAPRGYDPDDSWQFLCNQTADNGGANVMHYCNPVVDQAELAQRSTADQAKRLAAFHTIHAAILDDVPVMYYTAESSVGIYRSTLHNYMPFEVGTDLWNCWDWYVDHR